MIFRKIHGKALCHGYVKKASPFLGTSLHEIEIVGVKQNRFKASHHFGGAFQPVPVFKSPSFSPEAGVFKTSDTVQAIVLYRNAKALAAKAYHLPVVGGAVRPSA